MPQVRIDLMAGKPKAFRQGVGQVVYEALVTVVGVPRGDHFQVIHEHKLENFIFDPNYLGIKRSANLIMVQIVFLNGRTVAQKKALYKAIADGLNARVGLRREDLFVYLIDTPKENWSFGNGLAQYAM